MGFQTPYLKRDSSSSLGRRRATKINYKEDTLEEIENDNYSVIRKAPKLEKLAKLIKKDEKKIQDNKKQEMMEVLSELSELNSDDDFIEVKPKKEPMEQVKSPAIDLDKTCDTIVVDPDISSSTLIAEPISPSKKVVAKIDNVDLKMTVSLEKRKDDILIRVDSDHKKAKVNEVKEEKVKLVINNDASLYLMNSNSKFNKRAEKIFKPFKVPYKDPKKQQEYKDFNYNAIPLGLRPRFNHKSLLKPLFDPDAEDAIVLYRPETTFNEMDKLKMASKVLQALDGKKPTADLPEVAVVVDPKLARVLRPHQIEGVKFLYNCVTGRKVSNSFGCIMADEMGLGKTLQCITLLWTLLKQSPIPMKPTAERCVIACPSSLVKNWANELVKWLGPGRINPIVCDHKPNAQLGSAKEQLTKDMQRFMRDRGYGSAQVLIISYETLRMNVDVLGKVEIGLLLCDEGHRLKNSTSLTFVALNQLNVKRRVILSGTPIQNDLSEYFSLLNFTNPNLLGTPSEFRRNFEIPILKGRDADATQTERDLGDKKLSELNTLVSPLIIRRTNDLLMKYLPTKYEHVVFCKLAPVQQELYELYIKSKAVKKLLKSGDAVSLQAITLLKKLASSPELLDLPEDIEGSEEVLPEIVQEKAASGSRSIRAMTRDNRSNSTIHIEWSSKLILLDRMLAQIRKTSSDKVVLISNYTSTLELFQKLATFRGYSYLRLDGSQNVKKRQKLVDQFNDPEGTDFLFLLSSKAGGCGINLIGANRLFLFDPDWNPASDQQALARIWRDGQRKTCYIYRLIAAGTIEEKIFQRQTHKQTLSSCVVDDQENMERHFSVNNLRDLFNYNRESSCETHNTYGCKFGCASSERPNMTYGDLSTWSHFPKSDRLRFADNVLKVATNDFDPLEFVFQFKSHDAIKV